MGDYRNQYPNNLNNQGSASPPPPVRVPETTHRIGSARSLDDISESDANTVERELNSTLDSQMTLPIFNATQRLLYPSPQQSPQTTFPPSASPDPRQPSVRDDLTSEWIRRWGLQRPPNQPEPGEPPQQHYALSSFPGGQFATFASAATHVQQAQPPHQNPASMLSPNSQQGIAASFPSTPSDSVPRPSPGPSNSPFGSSSQLFSEQAISRSASNPALDQLSPSGSDLCRLSLGQGGPLSPAGVVDHPRAQPQPMHPVARRAQSAFPANSPGPVPSSSVSSRSAMEAAPAHEQGSRPLPRKRAPQEDCKCPIDLHPATQRDRPVPHFRVLHAIPRNRSGDMGHVLVFVAEMDSKVEVLKCQCEHGVEVKDFELEPLSEDDAKQAEGFRSLFENRPLGADDPQLLNDHDECARLSLYAKRGGDSRPQQMTFFNEHGEPVPFDSRWEGKLAFTCYPNCRAIPFQLSKNTKGSLNADKTPIMFRQLRRTTEIAKSTLTDLFVDDFLKNDPEFQRILSDNGRTLYLSAPLYAQGSRKRECFCLVKLDGCAGSKRKANDTADLELDTQGNNEGENDPAGRSGSKRTKSTPSNQSQPLGSSHPNVPFAHFASGASGADMQQDTEMTAADASEEKKVESNPREEWTQLDTTLLYDSETVLRIRREIKRPSCSKPGNYDTTRIRDVTPSEKSLYKLDLWGPSDKKVTIFPSNVIHVIDEKTPEDPLCCIELRFELTTGIQTEVCFERAVDYGHVAKVLFLCDSRENDAAEWQRMSVVCPRRSADAGELPHFFFVHEEDLEEFNETDFISSREWGPGVDLLPLVTELECSPTDERITATRRLVKNESLSDYDILYDRAKVIKAVERNIQLVQPTTISAFTSFTAPQSLASPIVHCEKHFALQPSESLESLTSAISHSEESHTSLNSRDLSSPVQNPGSPHTRAKSPDSAGPQECSLAGNLGGDKGAGSEPNSPACPRPPLSSSTASTDSDVGSTGDHSISREVSFGSIHQ